MSVTPPRHRKHSAAEKPLLSNSSLLILSGFLFGIVLMEVVPESFRLSATLGGVVGVFAYFAFQSATHAREQKAAAHRVELVAMQLEGKVARHVLPLGPTGKRRRMRQSQPATERQYLTVAGSQRNPRHPLR